MKNSQMNEVRRRMDAAAVSGDLREKAALTIASLKKQIAYAEWEQRDKQVIIDLWKRDLQVAEAEYNDAIQLRLELPFPQRSQA